MENEKAIEEQMMEAEQAAEPGTMVKGQVIQGDDVTAPMVASNLTSAGYVYIYDTRTGDRSLCNRNMLEQHIKKKRPDGSQVFTTVKPNIEIKRGALKCLLHADDPNRSRYDVLGLAVCRKANLTSPYQVRRHMEKRHKMEWQTIEQERKDREKLEEREFQRNLMNMAIKTEKVERPLYVSDKDKAKGV